MNLVWLSLAILLLLGALKWLSNIIQSKTGIDPMDDLIKRLFPVSARAAEPSTTRKPAPGRNSGNSNPMTNQDVRRLSGTQSPSPATHEQGEELRAVLREIIREELSKHRNDLLADLQGSLRALTERIDGMQRAQPITEQKLHQQTSTPASVPVRRAASEGELLSHWRTLRASNQVSAARMLELAAGAGVTLAEAPGLSASDPLARLGFLLTDGQGTVWFVPRPACKPSELSGIYSFPVGTHPAGVVTEVLRFARWQGNGIATPGEAR